jgi:hypothetical protein
MASLLSSAVQSLHIHTPPLVAIVHVVLPLLVKLSAGQLASIPVDSGRAIGLGLYVTSCTVEKYHIPSSIETSAWLTSLRTSVSLIKTIERTADLPTICSVVKERQWVIATGSLVLNLCSLVNDDPERSN